MLAFSFGEARRFAKQYTLRSTGGFIKKY